MEEEDIEYCDDCGAEMDDCNCETCELCGEVVDVNCDCSMCCSCGDKTKAVDAKINYCGDTFCEHCCSRCGYYKQDCNCCRYCKCTQGDCECYSSFGVSSSPGWEKRGHKIGKIREDRSYTEVWPELNTKIDPVQEAATFYLLEGISHGLPYLEGKVQVPTLVQSTKSIDRFIDLFGDDYVTMALGLGRKSNTNAKLKSISMEAALKLNQVTEEIVDSLWAYVHIAISGEARHHIALGGRVFRGPRDLAWSAWRKVYDQVGTDGIKDLAELFYEFEDSSFGGELWAHAAEILYFYEKGTLGPDPMVNKRMFLDRVFTMVHNNGSLLDKVSWANHQPIHLHRMNMILDAHAADDPNWAILYNSARPAAKQIMDAWHSACERYVEESNLKIEVVSPKVWSKKVKHCGNCGAAKGSGHYLDCKYMMLNSKVSYNEFHYWDAPVYKKQVAYDSEGTFLLDLTDEPVTVGAQLSRPEGIYEWETSSHKLSGKYEMNSKLKLPKPKPNTWDRYGNNMISISIGDWAKYADTYGGQPFVRLIGDSDKTWRLFNLHEPTSTILDAGKTFTVKDLVDLVYGKKQ